MDVQIRPGRPEDRAFVIDSIVSTFRDAPQAQGASNVVLASLVEPLLDSPHWRLAVAHPPGDGDSILGFVLYGVGFRVPVVAWVHVRGPFRRHGIGHALVRHALGDRPPHEIHTPFLVQHVDITGPPIVDLARRHGLVLRFRPYYPLQAALDGTRE